VTATEPQRVGITGAMTPDRRHTDRTDGSMRPSWSANPGFVNDEHRSVYRSTESIPGFQEEGDSYKLYEMGFFAGDVILEVGVYGGRSAVIELRGALANPERKQAPQFFGIDLDPAAISRSYETLTRHGLADHALLYHGDLATFAGEFAVQPTMVFVDGDHQYAGVKQDLETLTRILSPGVPVLCHDYVNPENDTGEYGIRRAATEWEEAGYAEFAGIFGCAALFVTSASCGAPRPGMSADRFAQRRLAHMRRSGLAEPDPNDPMVMRIREPMVAHIRELTERIRDLERRLQCAAEAHSVDASLIRQLEIARSYDAAAIANLEHRVAVLLTPRGALRRLAAAAARKVGLYDFLKRRF
jgi:hypothetical protein